MADRAGAPSAGVSRPARAIVLAASAVMVACAWLWVAQEAGRHATGAAFIHADHGASSLGSFIALVAMWQAMMIGMMSPAVVPWVLTLTRFMGEESRVRRSAYLAVFAAGYFGVWLGYSTLAAAAQHFLQQARLLDASEAVSGRVGGAVLVGAGLIQLTALKRACLTHCRNPLAFVLARWRDRLRGALEIGVRHGLYCVGCCWALMAVSFAAGVMNVVWMAIVALVVTLEQIAPGGHRVARVAGIALAAAGVAVLVAS
jgi:predicted metal-binding membrane protein